MLVPGWRPRWSVAHEQVGRAAGDLRSVVGRVLVDVWTVSAVGRDDWRARLPVVLELDDGRRLELCWRGLDQLSMSWQTIDLAAAPDDGTGRPLRWRRSEHFAVTPNRGSTIRDVGTTGPVRPPGRRAASFPPDVAGLWFATDGPGLHVFDALDENGLMPSYPAPHALRLLDGPLA